MLHIVYSCVNIVKKSFNINLMIIISIYMIISAIVIYCNYICISLLWDGFKDDYDRDNGYAYCWK